MTKVAVTGSKGRMGRQVVELILKEKGVSLAAEVDIGDSLEDVIEGVDVVIDFTNAEAAVHNASTASRHNVPIVIGTTGLNPEQEMSVHESAKTTAIVYSPNMSVGVNLMLKLIEIASRTLDKRYKVDIVETHHEKKLDKPSGTALKMLDVVCKTSGRCLNSDIFIHEEKGPDEERPKDSEVSVRSIRRGEVVGEHVIYFTSPSEIISIEHHATSRDVFAEGAVTAARWIIGKPAGLYTMGDVLNIK